MSNLHNMPYRTGVWAVGSPMPACIATRAVLPSGHDLMMESRAEIVAAMLKARPAAALPPQFFYPGCGAPVTPPLGPVRPVQPSLCAGQHDAVPPRVANITSSAATCFVATAYTTNILSSVPRAPLQPHTTLPTRSDYSVPTITASYRSVGPRRQRHRLITWPTLSVEPSQPTIITALTEIDSDYSDSRSPSSTPSQ